MHLFVQSYFVFHNTHNTTLNIRHKKQLQRTTFTTKAMAAASETLKHTNFNSIHIYTSYHHEINLDSTHRALSALSKNRSTSTQTPKTPTKSEAEKGRNCEKRRLTQENRA